MTAFTNSSAFQLIRRIAVSPSADPAIYLLICDPQNQRAVEADLKDEFDVHFGFVLRTVRVSDLSKPEMKEIFSQNEVEPALLVLLDGWWPELVSAMDKNVTQIETSAAKAPLLTTGEIAGRLLNAAPNLRSRFTDVLEIEPELNASVPLES